MMAGLECVVALTVSFMVLSTPVQGFPGGFPGRPAGYATLQIFSGCKAAGHTDGCCIGPGPSACSVRTPSGVVCYCDEACHMFEMGVNGGCCPDISNIGCVATTCGNAGLLPGCCRGTGSQCRTGHGCYCDKVCKKYRDCCSDVPRELMCENTERVLASQDQEETRPIQFYPGNDDYASKMEWIAERLMAGTTSHRKANSQNTRRLESSPGIGKQ